MPRLVPVALALFAGFEFRDFLRDGLPILFDAHSHLTRAWFVARAFEAGQFPSWANDWYGGFRLLEFYGPLYYWLTGGLAVLIQDVAAATKLVLWAAQVLSVLAFYGFLVRLSGRPLLAAFGALLLVASAQRTMVLGVIGNYPTVLLYLTIPVLLSCVLGNSSGPRSAVRLFAGQALLLSAMVLSHVTNSLLILPSILTFEILWLWQKRSATGGRWGPVAAVAGSLLAMAALTAFATAPMMADLDLVSLSLDSASPPELNLSAEPFVIFAGFQPHSWERGFLRNHETIWCAMALFGGLISLRSSGRRWRPLLAGLCVCLASMLIDDRAAIAAIFFLAPLCAVALAALSRFAAARGLPRVGDLVTILGIGFVALWPGSRPTPPPRYAPEGALDVYTRLPESPTRSRTFDVTRGPRSLNGLYGESSFSPQRSGRAIPFGGYPQGAPLATNVTLALAGKLAEELRGPNPSLSEDVLDFLYLLHVQFLIDRSEEPRLGRLHLDPTIGGALEPGVLAFGQASPAIFSPRIRHLPERYRALSLREHRPRMVGFLEELWHSDPLHEHPYRSLDPLFRAGKKPDWTHLLPLLRAMGIDRSAARAERFVSEHSMAPPRGDAGVPGGFSVIRHREDPKSVEIVARAAEPGFVRLSYSHDPGLIVSLDGEPTASIPDALGGAILLPFPAGTHAIELRAPEASLRIALLGCSALIALALVALRVAVRKRRATSTSRDRRSFDSASRRVGKWGRICPFADWQAPTSHPEAKQP